MKTIHLKGVDNAKVEDRERLLYVPTFKPLWCHQVSCMLCLTSSIMVCEVLVGKVIAGRLAAMASRALVFNFALCLCKVCGLRHCLIQKTNAVLQDEGLQEDTCITNFTP